MEKILVWLIPLTLGVCSHTIFKNVTNTNHFALRLGHN